MKVFRVETEEREGPYAVGPSHYSDDRRNPSPTDDRGLRMRWLDACSNGYAHGYHFGFPDLSALKRWFHDTGWRAAADGRGHAVSVYEVENEVIDFAGHDVRTVMEGSTQLVFWKDAARRIARFDLSKLN